MNAEKLLVSTWFTSRLAGSLIDGSLKEELVVERTVDDRGGFKGGSTPSARAISFL